LYYLHLSSPVISLLGFFSGLIGTFILISGYHLMPHFFFISVFLLLSGSAIDCFQIKIWGEKTQISSFLLLIPILITGGALCYGLLSKMGVNVPYFNSSNALIWIIVIAAINTITFLGNHIYAVKRGFKAQDFFCVTPPRYKYYMDMGNNDKSDDTPPLSPPPIRTNLSDLPDNDSHTP
jgi:hypothetical protein